MSWFRKKKVEVIDLKILDTVNKKEEDLSSFNSNRSDNEIVGFNLSSVQIKKDIIELNYSKIKKSNYEITSEYYIFKIFSRIILKDKDFINNIEIIDKHMNRVKKEYEILQKAMNELHNSLVEDDTYLNDAYEKLRSIDEFHRRIKDILQDVKNQHFNLLKIATVNVCLNKSNQDLEVLYDRLNSFLNDYKSLKEASEYIFYNSGSIILDLVESIVNKINQSKNKEHLKTYDIKYFLKSDVVITLEFTEWIELYNKVKFVTKLLSDTTLVNDRLFKEKFNDFEMRYLILMMNLESNRKQKKI